jgi:hypothetical protein
MGFAKGEAVQIIQTPEDYRQFEGQEGIVRSVTPEGERQLIVVDCPAVKDSAAFYPWELRPILVYRPE